MRYAFSTLSCPAWSGAHTAEEAARMGYDAVELRLLNGELIDPKRDARALGEAVAIYRERGVEVCALDTSCRFNLSDPQERAAQREDLLRWISLAQLTSVPLLRVFGGSNPDAAAESTDAWVAEGLQSVALEAEQASVTIALETHDAFSSATRVGRVLDRVASPAVGALWDSHHPYRVGESAQDVVEDLGERIVHVHVKDAQRHGNDWQLVLLGEGEVPVREQLRILKARGYTGYVSVEWEKKWHPEIADPEIALPQHLAWLKQVEATL